MDSSSVVLIGPGAIGGSLAGGLIEAGHAPTLVARTPFERLRVQWPEGDLDVEVDCVTEPADLQPADVVIVATKATHNADIHAALRATVEAGSTVVIAQNGVDHRERFADVLPDGAVVLPAIPMLPCRREGPGQIIVGKPSRLTIPTGPSAALVESLFANSYIEIDATDDWVTAAWFKLVLNAASGGIGVLARRGSEVMSDVGAQNLMLQLMEEVAAVGRAEGANLAAELPAMMVQQQIKNAGGHTSSIVLDRLGGIPTEWRERNEVVVRVAAKHDIDVPINQAVTTLMRLSEPE